MKKLALLSILLAACGSSTRMADTKLVECEHGEIEVHLGYTAPQSEREQVNGFKIGVEVANNSHSEVTVKYITIQQVDTEDARYLIDMTTKNINKTIPEGELETYELATSGRDVRDYSSTRHQSDDIVTVVTVALDGGMTYRCRYVLPAPL